MTANYVNLVTAQTLKIHEGWLDHRSQDGHWARYWCVLNKDAILFFNSINTCKEALAGTIALGTQPRIELEEDCENGYKFDLFSLKRINTFKAATYLERELWKAYVEGIESGRVPEGIDLVPEQINEIQIALNELSQQKAFSRPNSAQQEASPLSPMDCFDTPNTSSSCSFLDIASDKDNGLYLEPASPTCSYTEQNSLRKIFFSDLARTDIPSWFFSKCSRDQAILILDNGSKYGNTLMREGTNDFKNLVISKRMENFGKVTYVHFVVTVQSSGYKIDVKNPHQPMKSLSEIMEFFVESSGRASTFPMTTNDLSTFGIGEKVYNYNTYKYKMVNCVSGAPVTGIREIIQHDADSEEETRSPIKQSGQTYSVVSNPLPPNHTAPVPPFQPFNHPASVPPSLPPNRPASVPPSLPPNRPASVPPSLPPNRPASVPPSLPPNRLASVPPSLPPNRPASVPPSLQPNRPASVPPSLPPNCPASVPPSLPPNRPASVPPSLPPHSRPPLKHSASLDTVRHGPDVKSQTSRDNKLVQLWSSFKSYCKTHINNNSRKQFKR